MSTSGPDTSSTPGGAAASSTAEIKKPFKLLPALRNGAAILATSVVLVEVVLRFLGLTDPILYERDPDVGYRLKPDQRVSYFRNEIVINSHGVRDPRPLDVRDPNKTRILCLGDSVTWGGIYERQADLFTSVAERQLGNVEIINAGVNGYSTTQMVRLYEKYLADLKPDLILFCIILRDFERPPLVQLSGEGVGFPEKAPNIALVEALKICRQSAYDRLRWNWLRPPIASVPVQSTDTVDEFANIDAIVALSKKLQGQPNAIVVFLPVGTSDVTRSFRHAYVQRMQDQGVPVRSLRRAASLTSGDFVDGVHLAASGHKKVGAALATVIYEELAPHREEDPRSTREPESRRDR